MYFFKQKFEVFKIFKVFKDLFENLSGKNIKVLRIDNVKEYLNNNLYNLLRKMTFKFNILCLSHHNKMVW